MTVAAESVAYQLAQMHSRRMDPDAALLTEELKPADALVREFQWILDDLNQRCSNPEQTLAGTIIETWYVLQKKGVDLTILEVARDLSLNAQSTARFGSGRVNFRMTSRWWLAQQIKQAQP